jgi:hypothetical protein
MDLSVISTEKSFGASPPLGFKSSKFLPHFFSRPVKGFMRYKNVKGLPKRLQKTI